LTKKAPTDVELKGIDYYFVEGANGRIRHHGRDFLLAIQIMKAQGPGAKLYRAGGPLLARMQKVKNNERARTKTDTDTTTDDGSDDRRSGDRPAADAEAAEGAGGVDT
jgi:hypothetical protein